MGFLKLEQFGQIAKNCQLWILLEEKWCTLPNRTLISKLFKITFLTTFISTSTLYNQNWTRWFLTFFLNNGKNSFFACIKKLPNRYEGTTYTIKKLRKFAIRWYNLSLYTNYSRVRPKCYLLYTLGFPISGAPLFNIVLVDAIFSGFCCRTDIFGYRSFDRIFLEE